MSFTVYVTLLTLLISAQTLAESLRNPRQFISPSNPYSLYMRYLNENLYANELSKSKISWNGFFNSEDDYGVQTRQNLFGLSNINSVINPFASFINRFPIPNLFIRNPDASPLVNSFTACKDSTGLDGICSSSIACTKFGGRPSGSCGLGSVCCVNSVSKCGGQVTLNNTYWRSPATISSGSTCGLTVKLDSNLIEQKTKICQVRLDFLSFTTEQPNAETVCNVDSFQVVGATNSVPVICGDNPNQHMYIHLPSTATADLQLLFIFGSTPLTRTWNIKISLLPCLANYLAPSNCLQYFREASGTIKSFNWRDAAVTAPRQLANQNYRICFRTELASSTTANRICYTQCSVTNGGAAFSLSTSAGPDQSQPDVPTCNNDFLLIPGGYDPAGDLTDPANALDRYCGQALNPAAGGGPVTVCSTVKEFSVTYRTNGDETITPTPDDFATDGIINTGFCLDFQQRTA